LRTAFGLGSGSPPDRFLMALAVLGLLSDVAEGCPLVCIVDDEQWLDRASAQLLSFVARRLDTESVGLIFAARTPSSDMAGLPELPVEGLREDDARALLDSVLTGPLDARVREQIISETRGNPLALLELPRGMAGGFALLNAQALTGRIEQSYVQRLQSLPEDTRLLVLLAAAEPTGDAMLLWRAAERLGIGLTAADGAEAQGLLAIGARVRFRHSLVRSAIYNSATAQERRAVHLALAKATDQEVDPDRRAWHLAAAAAGPDEEVASELERSAVRAQARGGLAAAAAFLQRSLALTREPSRRGRRALAAAQASLQAGAFDATPGLLATAEVGPLDEFQRAQVDLVRAQLSFAVNRGSDAPPLLLKAAKQFASLDPQLARDTYLEALFASMFAGRLGKGGGLLSVAQAARAAPPAPEPPRAADLLLDGYTLAITEGYAVGAPILQRAVKAFQSPKTSSDEVLRWTFLACYAAQSLWDEGSYRAIPTRSIQLARDAGALSVLPLALTYRMGEHLHAGELGAAASMLEDLDVVTEATGVQLPPYAAVALASWRGREAEYEEMKKVSLSGLVERGEGMGVTFVEWTTAVLYNGLGKYGDALAAAQAASEHGEELQSPLWLHELVEAAARSGNRDVAAEALEELCGMTRVIGTDWALGIEARSRALLSEKAAAERLYSKAIDHLERTVARVELARARLLYGEWLRREGRRVDARAQLRAAHDQLSSVGAEAFAERARHELLATGERVRKRTVETRDVLTAQERQIAHLARDGLSNPEIGGRLFISPRTVKYHLSKVFTKLDISSRAQLAQVLPSEPSGVGARAEL
jgi:DNA-binding CsgD family transcriptional regulator